MKPDEDKLSLQEIAAFREGLEAATPIRKLSPFPRIFVDPDRTSIYWGGALTGHRSVVVFTHKGGPLSRDEPGGTVIAEDIVTFISAD